MQTPEYTLLTSNEHQHYCLQDDPHFSHAREMQLVAAGFNEVVSLASCMPVVVVGETGSTQTLAAIQSLHEHHNAFAQSGWQGHVVPLSIQTYPFNFAIEDNTLLTLIDTNSRRWQSDGTSLFSPDGLPSPLLKQKQSQLSELANGLHLAEQFVTYLTQKQLLEPLQVKVSYQDGTQHDITGISTINETALNALPADELKQLQHSGMLIAIHAMILSLRQFNRLVQLARSQGEPVSKITLSQ